MRHHDPDGGSKEAEKILRRLDEACGQRKEVYRTIERFFWDYTVWILPAAPSVAFPLKFSGGEFITENGKFSYSRYKELFKVTVSQKSNTRRSYGYRHGNLLERCLEIISLGAIIRSYFFDTQTES